MRPSNASPEQKDASFKLGLFLCLLMLVFAAVEISRV